MNAKHMAVGEGHAGLEWDHSTLISRLDQFASDTRFLESIRPELHNQYPNCWVAVYNKELVGTAGSLREIVKLLTDRNVPPSRAVIDFLRKEPIALIL